MIKFTHIFSTFFVIILFILIIINSFRLKEILKSLFYSYTVFYTRFIITNYFFIIISFSLFMFSILLSTKKPELKLLFKILNIYKITIFLLIYISYYYLLICQKGRLLPFLFESLLIIAFICKFLTKSKFLSLITFYALREIKLKRQKIKLLISLILYVMLLSYIMKYSATLFCKFLRSIFNLHLTTFIHMKRQIISIIIYIIVKFKRIYLVQINNVK